MNERGIVEADSLENLYNNDQNEALSNETLHLPLLSGSDSIGSESLDYRGYLDIEFDGSTSFSSEQYHESGSANQVCVERVNSQENASTRTIRPLSLLLNKGNPNEISSWICERREEESDGLTHGGWPTHSAELTPKQNTYCCFDAGRAEVESQELSQDRTSYLPSREHECTRHREADRIPVQKGQSYLLTEMDKPFPEGRKKNFNSPLPIKNVKSRNEQEKNFIQANKKNTFRSRIPEETSYCKTLLKRHAKDRPNASLERQSQNLPGRAVLPDRQRHVEVREEVPNKLGVLQHKWLAQASVADLSSIILEQKKQLEEAFDKLMKRIDDKKQYVPAGADQTAVNMRKGQAGYAACLDSHNPELRTKIHRPAKAHRNYLRERHFLPPPPGPDCSLGPDFSSETYKEQRSNIWCPDTHYKYLLAKRKDYQNKTIVAIAKLTKRTRQAAYAEAIRKLTRKGESLVKLPPLNPSALTSHRTPAEYINTRQSSHEASGFPSTPSVRPSPKLSPTFERSRLPTGSGPSNHAGSHYHAEGNIEAEQETKPKSRRSLMLEYSKRLREIAMRRSKPAPPREKPTPEEAPTQDPFVVWDSNILNMVKRHEEENQTILAMANELKSS